MIDELDYQARENRILAEIKRGKKPSTEVAAEFVRAKLDLSRSVMADTLGGLFGPDVSSVETKDLGKRYEHALAALEKEIL